MSESTVAVSDAVASMTTISGAVEAVANAPESISRLFELAERFVYGAGYTAAFVITFPVALMFAAVPKGNALMRGVLDGSADAQARAKQMLG